MQCSVVSKQLLSVGVLVVLFMAWGEVSQQRVAPARRFFADMHEQR